MIGIISFFYLSGQTNPFIRTMFDVVSILMIYALFSSTVFIVREIRKKNELVKKVTIDSMAMAFVIIVILHIVQMVVRVVYFNKTGNDINLLVTSGLSIESLGDSGSHLESFGVDLAIFSASLFVNRLRYSGRTEWIKHRHAVKSEEIIGESSKIENEETEDSFMKF